MRSSLFANALGSSRVSSWKKSYQNLSRQHRPVLTCLSHGTMRVEWNSQLQKQNTSSHLYNHSSKSDPYLVYSYKHSDFPRLTLYSTLSSRKRIQDFKRRCLTRFNVLKTISKKAGLQTANYYLDSTVPYLEVF